MTRLDSVTLEVQDLARSVAFYRLLGLSVPDHPRSASYVCTAVGNGCRLEWVVVGESTTVSESFGDRERGVEPVIRCSSPTEVDAVVRAIAAAGYQVESESADTLWGARSARVVDPDGHTVRVFAAYP